MDLERTPHQPQLYVGGVELKDVWLGADLWLTSDEIFAFCEEEVEELHQWDLCMRMAICIEEYQAWWRRCSGKT